MEQQPVPKLTRQMVRRLLDDDEPARLFVVPLCVSLEDDSSIYATNICLQLADHRDPKVRANAIVGFGHIIERFGTLSAEEVKLVLDSALVDDDPHVRNCAIQTATLAQRVLAWTFERAT